MMSNQDIICEVIASVPGGFEKIAARDVSEKMNFHAVPEIGRIKIDVPYEEMHKLKELPCVDHLYVIVKNTFDSDICTCGENDAFNKFNALIPNLPWIKAFQAWQYFNHHDIQWDDKSFLLKKNGSDINSIGYQIPTFRATCVRKGKHNFQSPDVEKKFGGALQDYFNWIPKMKDYDLEIIVNIRETEILINISLTSVSLHLRNITHFGPTTLRPTIAYNMLASCDIKIGDIVCDMMCGGGSIPIECSIHWPHSYTICGDNHMKAFERCKENFNALNEKLLKKQKKPVSCDISAWDVCYLPLRDRSVDVLITDMPYGKRSGNKKDNWQLYLCLLKEMARVVSINGRVCLLTHDEKCMIKSLRSCKSLWHCNHSLSINQGGLKAKIYFLSYKNTADTN